jgi:hypothetical protein
MLNVYVVDLCERHGCAHVYGAACAATRGDLSQLAGLGLFGYTPEGAHGLCQMIERAWFSDADAIAARAIQRAGRVSA